MGGRWKREGKGRGKGETSEEFGVSMDVGHESLMQAHGIFISACCRWEVAGWRLIHQALSTTSVSDLLSTLSLLPLRTHSYLISSNESYPIRRQLIFPFESHIGILGT